LASSSTDSANVFTELLTISQYDNLKEQRKLKNWNLLRHKKKLVQDRGRAAQGAQKALKVQLFRKRVKPVGKNRRRSRLPDQPRRQKSPARKIWRQQVKARKDQLVDESLLKKILLPKSSSHLDRGRVEFNHQWESVARTRSQFSRVGNSERPSEQTSIYKLWFCRSWKSKTKSAKNLKRRETRNSKWRLRSRGKRLKSKQDVNNYRRRPGLLVRFQRSQLKISQVQNGPPAYLSSHHLSDTWRLRRVTQASLTARLTLTAAAVFQTANTYWELLAAGKATSSRSV